MKTGLVLEGGGMRCLYTSGILDTFLQNNIEFDGVIGVSGGALFGIDFVAKQKGRSITYTRKYAGDSRYMGIKSLITTGNIVNRDFAYYQVPRKLDIFNDETFQESPTQFYATVTNVSTGKAEYMKIDSVFKQTEVLRATSAMPLLSKMILLDNGQYYLDGAISDSIPLEAMKQLGYDRIVVILTRTHDYVKKPYSKFLMHVAYSKYPNLLETLMHRHEIYNEQLANIREQERNGEIVVLRPSANIKMRKTERNPNVMQSMYDLGKHDANLQLSEVKQFLYF